MNKRCRPYVDIQMQIQLIRSIFSLSMFLAAAGTGIQCHQIREAAPVELPAMVETMRKVSPEPMATPDPLVARAAKDPLGFLNDCRREYDQGSIRDYTCTFSTQELVNGKITKIQQSRVDFREKPFSVHMQWFQNPPAAKRALFVEGAWNDDQGQPLAWFKPSGSILSLIVPKIQQPIHGKAARATARRSIDQFGFSQTLDLIIEYSERGRDDGVLQLTYRGEGVIDGRPTLVFERRLPYTGEEYPYPDALLRFHVDREWLVPVACFSFADDEEKQLLGSYVITDVKLNVGLGDDDFDVEKIGF